MDWVLDSSAALAWALPDEQSEEAEKILTQISPRDIFWVPALWWHETSNALVAARQRKRLKEADRLQILYLFSLLPNLELSLRKGLNLATFDRRLRQAATKAGVDIFS